MLVRAIVAPLVLVLALAGCVPQPDGAPTDGPSPSVTTPTPSGSASETPAAPVLQIPDSCVDLVPLATIHAQFATSFEPIALSPTAGDPVAQLFAARGGLICLWGIPNSDAGSVTAYVAPRATATDQLQVDAWVADGFSECPPFLDACYYETDPGGELSEFWTAHVLVEGFEIRVQATSTSLDPLLVVARAVSDSMGYL